MRFFRFLPVPGAAVVSAPLLPAMNLRILDCGDAAFTIEFGDRIDAGLLDRVNRLDRAIARARGDFPGLIETMPTFRSLTLFFDPLQTGRRQLLDALAPLLAEGGPATDVEGRCWTLPVCYEAEAAPDLHAVAQASGLSADEVIALHSGSEYRVYMLGFLPGFAFMGDLPPALNLPRRSDPRTAVPAGSVAIAGALTAIYPWQSPGGWHLLGLCALPLFDAGRESPALLAAGDRVRFRPQPDTEYRRLLDAVCGGEVDPLQWCTARSP